MKKIKLALLTAALAGSSMVAMAQDKAALIKQFIEIQRPGIESLARGLVEQSSAPIAQAGSQYLQTQVPEAKRESAVLEKRADTARVAIRGAIENAIEPAEETTLGVVTLFRFLQDGRAQRRRQHQRH